MGGNNGDGKSRAGGRARGNIASEEKTVMKKGMAPNISESLDYITGLTTRYLKGKKRKGTRTIGTLRVQAIY